MPSALTFPGIYIEEIPSGVRTITGVATSITAFIGRTLRGPRDEPVVINSYGDFERIFGGLWVPSPMTFSVRDFFPNGGSQAIIVRLFSPTFEKEADRVAALNTATNEAQTAANAVKTAADAAATAPGATADSVAQAATGAVAAAGLPSSAAMAAATAVAKAANDAKGLPGADAASVQTAVAGAVAGAVATAANNAAPSAKAGVSVNGLDLEAVSEGSWGNALRVRVDDDVMDDATTIKQIFGPAFVKADLFNLTVRDAKTGVTEQFRNITAKDSARRVDKVLKNDSLLVRAPGTGPFTRPTAHAAPDPGKDGFEDTAHSSWVNKPASNGKVLTDDAFTGTGKEAEKTGLFALEKADLFNLLCIPPHEAGGDISGTLVDKAAAYCEKKRAMLIVDPPAKWKTATKAKDGLPDIGTTNKNAALFFPRLRQPNPLHDDKFEDFVPCGAVAGVFARTDAQRGVWKAPAGLDATLVGVPQLTVPLTDKENGQLNPLGVNCLRTMPAAGRVVWGSRTLRGNDRLASEWKYIPVRRTALFIEESLYRALQWVVFEPNDEPLWAQIRLNVGAFLNSLFRQGAFQGSTPREAYFVKCDKETTTQNDIDRGIVNILVGFAPLKPAEFVVIKLQQIAGQIQT